MRIWTEAYRPWIMGGDCNAPVVCDVSVAGPLPLGKGYQGFLAIAPSGATFVIESETGAIVGSTIEDVRKDVERADEKVMQEQIASAKIRAQRAVAVSLKEFWKLLRVS